ncbi:MULTISPECIES: GlxA family transcriptional regulator [Pseudomonas]|uniref:Transcriptional regulator, AraC family with amidase-like domain n=1 Tax=Pseudomonas segetis TaxID=298908 RepID=A0A238ZWQ7_9PSED|nr:MULTISPECIES: GlxA family transcriptional regulator [Pseudomonas]SNR87689.1 transcriptional regulator, AraC family with amidase-like domain [Pseudomonas segetis]
MKTVAVILFPELLLLDVAGPVEVFSIANRYLEPQDRYEILTIASDSLAVRTSSGITLTADSHIDQAGGFYDVLIVPGGPGAYKQAFPALQCWLRKITSQVQLFASVCTGAFILGQAGLLDGRRVTTHWNYTERLAEKYPEAKVETDQIFVRDGNLITSGGVTTGIDLALSIIAQDHGKKIALSVAKVLLVVMQRQGGQMQFSPLVADVAKDDSPIFRVRNYVLENVTEDFSVERMASLAAMSARHFARTFTREVNMTPMEFVQSARIDNARRLLESSNLPLKTVAYRSGFGSARHMRHLFVEKLGLPPSQYRRQFS